MPFSHKRALQARHLKLHLSQILSFSFSIKTKGAHMERLLDLLNTNFYFCLPRFITGNTGTSGFAVVAVVDVLLRFSFIQSANFSHES